ncbi:SDR family oxidoreductase [Flavobacteriaceae bacterium S356]|uniref:SDR family oxidoreductase n=1 Tax=Asprobacillus argus TaxID=3076534 RepID=A0ABU3LE68_9FLAO|nr:SDR family oxidoreductase [Flavobacteriaceae bacterium S356]
MSYVNKVVWITGASSGIGKALALHLAEQGAKLIVSSRKKEDLNKVKELCQDPDNIYVLDLDLAQHANFKEKAKEAIKAFGRVDVLVNNGGISQRSLVKDTSIDVDERIMNINYLGTIALTKAVLPHFIENQSGQFVVTTSIVGKIGTPLRSSYAASKHALHGFFDSLRAEVYNDKIAITLICPGYVTTNVSMNALTGDGTPQQTMDKATANGIKPERFAKLMVRAMSAKKEEAYIAGAKEKLGVYVKRWIPKLFSIMVRKLSVT